MASPLHLFLREVLSVPADASIVVDNSKIPRPADGTVEKQKFLRFTPCWSIDQQEFDISDHTMGEFRWGGCSPDNSRKPLQKPLIDAPPLIPVSRNKLPPSLSRRVEEILEPCSAPAVSEESLDLLLRKVQTLQECEDVKNRDDR
jgi:hypothetical protein